MVESSSLIENNSTRDVSEQDVMDCAVSWSGCEGANWSDAFSYIEVDGTAPQSSLPYVARNRQCRSGIARPYHSVASAPLSADWKHIPSPKEIKNALCEHGPLYTGIIATNTFMAYAGGVYSQVEHVDFDSEEGMPSSSWVGMTASVRGASRTPGERAGARGDMPGSNTARI